MFKLASCKHFVLMSLTIVLKFILSLLGLSKRKGVSVDDHGNQQTEHKELLKEKDTDCFRMRNRKEQSRRRGEVSSGDCSGESAEEESFVTQRKLQTPRNRRYLRHGIPMTYLAGMPMTSTPLHAYSRQYSSSSGFSTGSDVMISDMNSFADHSVGVDITKGSFTEMENVKLKSALDSLIKEKTELQEKLIQQHERLSRKTVQLDRESVEKYPIKSTYSTLDSLDCKHISLKDCPSQHKSQSSSLNVCKQNQQLNHMTGYQDDTYLCCQSSSRRQSTARATDVTRSSMLDILDKDEMLEKMRILKKDNVRLKEYINGLLFMVLENSPSLLEAKQHTHKMYTFSEL